MKQHPTQHVIPQHLHRDSTRLPSLDHLVSRTRPYVDPFFHLLRQLACAREDARQDLPSTDPNAGVDQDAHDIGCVAGD